MHHFNIYTRSLTLVSELTHSLTLDDDDDDDYNAGFCTILIYILAHSHLWASSLTHSHSLAHSHACMHALRAFMRAHIYVCVHTYICALRVCEWVSVSEWVSSLTSVSERVYILKWCKTPLIYSKTFNIFIIFQLFTQKFLIFS